MRKDVGAIVASLLLLVLVMSVPVVAAEKEYPSRPITLIVPYAAGGGTDIMARVLQKGLEKILPVPVAIINIGGGSGSIGLSELMAAEPDGYTMAIDITNCWTNKILGTADFGPLDFEPVAQTGEYYLVYAVGGNSPYNSLKDIYNKLKKEPKSVIEATNIGAITHFTTLALQDVMGVEIRLVHIGDGASRIQNVLGGHVDATIMGVQEVFPYYKSGEMKVIATFSEERLDAMPDVPTAKEQGFDVVRSNPYWIFMPKGTPENRVVYMADALEKVMQDPEILDNLESLFMETTFLRNKALVENIKKVGEEIVAIAERHGLSK
ncbi:MAG: putative tricarboxylic transport rane protein [Candidatus Atribacteria bacterium]|nr:putative tricarboxylic transport rane protein [Candidatus Atribacteria bacterium]